MLNLIPEPEKEHYILYDDLIIDVHKDIAFISAQYYEPTLFAIPAGFSFDGASIPRAFWSAVTTPFHPSVIRAAIAHDWLYYTHIYSRQVCDRMLLDIMKYDGVSLLRRRAIYRAVRLFGGGYWDNDENDIAVLEALSEKHKHNPNYALFGFKGVL